MAHTLVSMLLSSECRKTGRSPERLGLEWGLSGGTVRNLISGGWANYETQKRVAAGLGFPVEQLFPEDANPRKVFQARVRAMREQVAA